MPKRGLTQPWRVSFEWENGVKGTAAHYSEDEANLAAEKIRAAGVRRDLAVSVTVSRRPVGPDEADRTREEQARQAGVLLNYPKAVR